MTLKPKSRSPQPDTFNRLLYDIKNTPLPKVGRALLPLIKHLGIDAIINLNYLKFKSADDLYAQIDVSQKFYIYKKNKTRLVCYIGAFRSYQEQYKSLPKYHIYTSCETIKAPHTYVYSNDASGDFEGDMGKRRLALCQICAKNYRTQFHREFNLKEFVTNQ